MFIETEEHKMAKLGLTPKDLYILNKIKSLNISYSEEKGLEETFTFKITDLFQVAPLVFLTMENDMSKEEKIHIKKLNYLRFDRILKGNLRKVLIKSHNSVTQKGNIVYFKFI